MTELAAATQQYDVYSQCVGKVKYPDVDAALFGAHKMADRERAKGTPTPFTVYHCPWCGLYHVGRVPR